MMKAGAEPGRGARSRPHAVRFPARCFLAISVPEAEARRLRRALSDMGLQEGRLEAAQRFHITLRFLGNIDGDALDRLDRVCDRIAGRQRCHRLRVKGAGTFPSAPVVWLGVDGDLEELAALWRSIQVETTGIGDARGPQWDDPDWAFRPHITVMRVEGTDPGRRVHIAEAVGKLGLTAHWDVSRFALFLSKSDGAYEVLRSYSLRG